ncbi:MAG: primosomal protein N' (replication factor Y) - superfamily II helicase [Geminicoccaceae bacterium]|nr:MAG: primosomal protein N' (replication factor Y) - superfamily II helicase [Geminicoccaceae bacterium]
MVGPWGVRLSEPEPTAEATSDERDGRFACESCGAVLGFAPGTEKLSCSYCGHVNAIRARGEAVVEHDLDDRFARDAEVAPPTAAITPRCTGCGASFTFQPPLHAGPCPFCGTAVVAEPGGAIQPGGLLPFLIGEANARERITGWLQKLWFAPANVARKTRGRDVLHGSYVPFFTFDSRTETRYQGLRGDVYYQTVRVPVVRNGRRTTQLQQVPKVRWRPASGVVRRDFDDVLVPATATLPPSLTDQLKRFDLHEVRAYQEEFLAGFESERFQVSLQAGFERARLIMRGVIQGDIRAHIGGDMQKITTMDVRHGQRAYKLVLLPIWRADLEFMGRTYRVLVNGRTGEVVGERPYSLLKIVATTVAALAATALTLWVFRSVFG